MVAMVTAGCARADFWGSTVEYVERSRVGVFQDRLQLELVVLIVLADREREN
jgi:hypothetical protein